MESNVGSEAHDEAKRLRKQMGVLAMLILQNDRDGAMQWARGVKVTFVDGDPEIQAERPDDRELLSNRQQLIIAKVEECFGAGDLTPKERGRRFIEEAIELAQAVGVEAGEIHRQVAYTYVRPVGEPRQEVGGVMVTLEGLTGVLGIETYAAYAHEAASFLAADPEKFRRKHALKAAAGIAAAPLSAARSINQQLSEAG